MAFIILDYADKISIHLSISLFWEHSYMEGWLVLMVNNSEKKLSVNQKWCKGCGVCVQYCPKKVLVIKQGKVSIEKPDECSKCGLCEQRCPDYAIFLRGKDND